jgi:hypothetical protein
VCQVRNGEAEEERKEGEGENLPGCSTPSSDTGVRGQNAGIKCGERGGIEKGLLVLPLLRASSWRCQSLQEIYSRRGPSWRDSLHFVKTDLVAKVRNESGDVK